MTQAQNHRKPLNNNEDGGEDPAQIAAMRIIVPLQGVVQGRGGLVLGSLIPCALFYFLQLYLKRKNKPPSSPPPSSSQNNNGEFSVTIPRTLSRSLLSPGNPSAPAQLSSRASAVISKSAAEDSVSSVGYKKWVQDPYHSSRNPNGVIQLALAENRLSLDLIRDWLVENAAKSLLDEEEDDLGIRGLVTYQRFDGLMDLKIAVARFMAQVRRGSVSFDPSQIILTSGASSAIEILSVCIADPGNAFLVPSPYYPGFDNNVKWRAGVELIHVPCRSTDKFNISVTALERAYIQAKKRGIKIRAILISNPSNPAGNFLTRDALCDLVEFATEKNIHLISDEVFAGSIYGHKEFVSIAEVLNTEDLDKSRVHIIYGLSKDLVIPGFRVGVIYSLNENVLSAATKFARFSSVSVPTQRLLVSMLLDEKFILRFIETNRARLQKMYNLFVMGLRKLGIECFDSSGGFYCWADMSKFLRSYNEKGENELWDKLLNIGKINVMPGSSCHCIEPGWFRLCFTTLEEDKDIAEVMERIRRVIESHSVQR